MSTQAALSLLGAASHPSDAGLRLLRSNNQPKAILTALAPASSAATASTATGVAATGAATDEVWCGEPDVGVVVASAKDLLPGDDFRAVDLPAGPEGGTR